MASRKFLILFFLLFISVYAPAQTVKVKKEKTTLKGESMEGYAVDLDGSLTEVNASFFKFLKTIGKAKQSDFITVNEPDFNGLSYPAPVFGLTRENGKSVTAWIGFNASDWKKEDSEKVMKELENVMKDFGVKFYRDQIQKDIDESEKASQTVQRSQQRLLNENRSLSNKLENNKREKINLEKALEDNKNEHVALLKKIEENKKAQDSVSVAAEQIRKVVEVHKEKQRKVN